MHVENNLLRKSVSSKDKVVHTKNYLCLKICFNLLNLLNV